MYRTTAAGPIRISLCRGIGRVCGGDSRNHGARRRFLLAFVFAQGDVSHPVQTVFDAPVPTPMANQKGRVGPGARKAGDGVLNLDRAATFAAGCALKSANLRHAGPIEMAGQSRAGLQVPLNSAAMPFADRMGFRQRRSSLVFRGGGKIRAGNPRPPRLSTRAGCP